MAIHETAMIAPSAIIAPDVEIGPHTKVWNYTIIRRKTRIGADTNVGSWVVIDPEVQIGNNVKIHSYVGISRPMIIEDGVFVGPYVMCANDARPRAINPDGTLQTDEDWEARQIRICAGASIGSHCVLLPGITVGRYAMIGAGAIVTRNVPERAIVLGVPGRVTGYACDCAGRLVLEDGVRTCRTCGRKYPDFIEGAMRPKVLR
ncbi:MAG: acetyltransferase [Chloroflexota bacterium]|nr:acetyltransferase [Chloroflexota bacterium]